ncbi:MAG: WG repeat-containing protein [Defluviitaleaceae bacterium]|nr:WG repeat-containing protein [Defluviitaleaceae bacterium]
MKKFTAIALVCALIVVGLTSVPAMVARADTPELVWIVPPTLPHESVEFCSNCGFTDENEQMIDPVTGRLTGERHGGHGMGRPFVLVYDPERNLLGEPSRHIGYTDAAGMFPFDEALTRFSLSGNLHAVETVDSSRRRYAETFWDFGDNAPWQEWWLEPEAHSGQFAVMYDGQFVTQFVFSGGGSFRPGFDVIPMYMFDCQYGSGWRLIDTDGNATTSRSFNEIHLIDTNHAVAVQNDVYGMIDRNGNIVVPFVFEHIVNIDIDTIFAKYNGQYGILDARSTGIVAAREIMLANESDETDDTAETADETEVISRGPLEIPPAVIPHEMPLPPGPNVLEDVGEVRFSWLFSSC